MKVRVVSDVGRAQFQRNCVLPLSMLMLNKVNVSFVSFRVLIHYNS